MRVIICGGGVIGASIAYFLSRRGIAATVVERTGVACAASGKSGGFLARDWCDGTPLAALARRSFDLHAELAERSAMIGATAALDDLWRCRRRGRRRGAAMRRGLAVGAGRGRRSARLARDDGAGPPGARSPRR